MAKDSEETPKTKRVGDPEILAISSICKSFDGLAEPVQRRVLAYVKAKYEAEWGESDAE